MPAQLCSSLFNLVQCCPGRVTSLCNGRILTSAQLHDQVALLSRGLSDLLGLLPGDRVALLGQNTDMFFQALLAVVDAGAIACPLNWRWSAAEAAAAIDLVQPTYVLADDHCMQLALDAQGLAAKAVPMLHMGPTSNLTTRSASGQDPNPKGGSQYSSSGSQLRSLDDLLIAAQARMSSSGGSQSNSQGGARGDIAGAAVTGNSGAATSSCNSVHTALPAATPATAATADPASPRTITHQPQLQLLQSGPEGVALICFTSGTTGRSKGAALTHSGLMHQSMSKLVHVGYCQDDVYLHVAPLFHIGGLSSGFAVLLAGGMHVFLPRFTAKAALQLIRQHRVTAMIAVPAMMEDLTAAAAAQAAAAHATAQEFNISAQSNPAARLITQQQQWQQQQQSLPSLRRVLVGAGGMSSQLMRTASLLFPNAQVLTAYGMTEAASSIAFIPLQQQQQELIAAAAEAARAAASAPSLGFGTNHSNSPSPTGAAVIFAGSTCAGLPAMGITVRVDASTVADKAPDAAVSCTPQHKFGQLHHQQQQRQQQQQSFAVGEVCTHGPHVMTCYWRDPQATAQAFTSDGWLRTGDLGFLDSSGRLWLLGRIKDMIKTGGENVHAAEVERVLLSHPGVAAAAVVGLKHPRLGEQVAAAIVPMAAWVWQDMQQEASQQLQQPPQQQGSQNFLQHSPEFAQQQPHQHKQQQPVYLEQQQQDHRLNLSILQQHCHAAGLTSYKLPRFVAAMQQLPCNSSGKVIKIIVKQQLIQLFNNQPRQQSPPSKL